MVAAETHLFYGGGGPGELSYSTAGAVLYDGCRGCTTRRLLRGLLYSAAVVAVLLNEGCSTGLLDGGRGGWYTRRRGRGLLYLMVAAGASLLDCGGRRCSSRRLLRGLLYSTAAVAAAVLDGCGGGCSLDGGGEGCSTRRLR